MIEDDPDDIYLLEKAIKEAEEEIELNTVNHGPALFEYLNKLWDHHFGLFPDIILLDLNLPRMNGLEILRTLKSDVRFKSIPVVIYTTSELNTDALNCYQSGANSYLVKPENYRGVKELIALLTKYWERNIKLSFEELL